MNSKQFCVEIKGSLAMFGTPMSKQSCEMISYSMPTYSALVGIMNHIYYCRGMKWVVDACRVMNEIKYETRNYQIAPYSIYSSLINKRMFVYSYLSDVRYQILAHYENDMSSLPKKGAKVAFVHDQEISRAIEMGGQRIVKLGKKSSGIATVKRTEWGSGEGYYDGLGCSEKIPMFYEFKFKQLEGKREITHIVRTLQGMENGYIFFDEKTPKISEIVRKSEKNIIEKVEKNVSNETVKVRGKSNKKRDCE